MRFYAFLFVIMSFHFPKSHRLLKSKEFSFIQRSGKRVYGQAFCLQLFQSPSKRPPRLGLTVSRKYGGSVQRNLFKRRLREIFRLSCSNLELGCIIHVKPQGKAATSAEVASFAQLKIEWEKLLKENGFFKIKEEKF